MSTQNFGTGPDAPSTQTTSAYGSPNTTLGAAATDYSVNQDAQQNKVMGILAYLGILFVVPLIAAKESRFAMYHANQGLVLFLFGMATGLVALIPFLGWIVGFAGWAVSVVLMIMGIINAANGQMKPLPLIGKYDLIR